MQKRTFKYAFKNINSDFDIMEHLNNIATAYMGFDIDKTNQIKNISSDITVGAMDNIV